MKRLCTTLGNASFVISSKNIPGKVRENPGLLKVYLKSLSTRSSQELDRDLLSHFGFGAAAVSKQEADNKLIQNEFMPLGLFVP